MKSFTRFLLLALCLVPFGAGADTVTPTLGSNLTAYNSGMGAINNNNWNNLMNNRSGGTAATADFGNCNAVILRCAQPKCASGGCTSLEIARPIVSGCVQSNENCKQYGNDLIEYISAQLVANSTAKANQQALAQQAAASQAAAQQSAQQLQEMQAQMQQMQSEMAAQNAQQMQQMQAALEEQKQLTAQAIADASAANTAAAQGAATTTGGGASTTMVSSPSGANQYTQAQAIAAQSGISADILAREQISGQILSKIENAEVAMKTMKASMERAFEYAGCDKSGNNCAGPKRVKAFKNYAMEFFEPYNDVLDELYDALITAQAVGVDITDIYMMLEGSCNVWGEYLCADTTNYFYGDEKTEKSRIPGKDETSSTGYNNCVNGKSVRSPTSKGGHECFVGQIIPAEDSPSCTLHRTLSDQAQVYRNWLYADNNEEDAMIRVGCASAALETSKFFRNRKKQASIDIETLQRIIEQDAPQLYGRNYWGTTTDPKKDGVKYCAINPKTLQDLQKVVTLKKLPNKVCVKEDELGKEIDRNGVGITIANAADTNKSEETSGGISSVDCTNSLWKDSNECKCRTSGGTWWGSCSCPQGYELVNNKCQFKYSSPIELKTVELNTNSLTSFTPIDFNKSDCERRNGTYTDNKCMCGNSEMGFGMKCVGGTLGPRITVDN